MRKLLLAAATATALAGSAVNASAYEGGWYFDNNPGGWEILYLGDGDDDTYLQLGGTGEACGRRGNSYAHMRRVISSNYPHQLSWWVDYTCGDLVRVCVENVRGQSGCSTYVYEGWVEGGD